MSARALTLAAAVFVPASAGQVVIETVGTTSWVVPDGVTSLCMVAVQPGADGSGVGTTVTVAGSIVCRALIEGRIGDGGGDGGQGGTGYWNYPTRTPGGGGGAGGYTGNGGPGANGTGGVDPSAQGGGGAGGSPGIFYDTNPPGKGVGAGGGGGVGLLGQGANGAPPYNYGAGGGGGSGGTKGPDGQANDGPSGGGGKYGGGPGGGAAPNPLSGLRGGALAWKNNVSVTPGQTITVYIPAPGSNGYYPGGQGAVRILWGDGRFFPSTNTGDV